MRAGPTPPESASSEPGDPEERRRLPLRAVEPAPRLAGLPPRTPRLLVGYAPLLAANLALLLVHDLDRHLVLSLIVVGAAFLALPFAVRRLRSATGGMETWIGRKPGSQGRAILWGALFLRLSLLPLPLTLSDDVLRYLWDGRVAAAGHDPYALPPEARELAGLRDATWRSLPHRDVPTVYPPLAVAAFSIAARLPFPILSWKCLAVGADLGTVALLLALARRRGLPEERVAWYAWNPLVVLEVAGMGHVDALGVAAAVGAVLLLTGREARGERDERDERLGPPRAQADAPAVGPSRWAVAGAAACAAAGALAKLAPIAAVPMWSRQSHRARPFLAAAAILLATALLPVFLATGGPPPGLVAYGMRWEFDGPLFEPLWRAIAAVRLAPFLAHRLDAWKLAHHEYYRLNWIYAYLYPQLLAKAVLALGSVAAVAASLREREPIAGTGRLFGRLLLLSATVYPWYLLWVLPWAALVRHRAWLVLSGLALLSYLPRATGVPLVPWVFAAVWTPFLALSALSLGASRNPWSTA